MCHCKCKEQQVFSCNNHASLAELQSVKAEGGLLKAADEFGAEWKHAAGAPRAKEAKGRHLVGAAVPSVHLRLDGNFRTATIASWAVNSSKPGAEALVCLHIQCILCFFPIMHEAGYDARAAVSQMCVGCFCGCLVFEAFPSSANCIFFCVVRLSWRPVIMQIDEAMKDLESWEYFNVFEVAKLVKGHILATVVFYALEHFDLFEKLDIPEDKFYNFVAVRFFPLKWSPCKCCIAQF